MKNSKFFKAVGFVVIVLILSAAFTGCETESHDVSGQYAGIEANAPANRVDILLFNDFHGNVAEDTRPGKGKNAGMAKMIGYVRTAGMENPNTIVVAGGDNYQGTAISNLT